MKNIFTSVILLCLFHNLGYCQVQFVSDCSDIVEIQELSTLNGLSGELQSSGSSNTIPFCIPDGIIDNPIWIAFKVDPYFEYSLSISFENCIPGQSFEVGGQLAIFENCGDWGNSIHCQATAIEGTYTIPDNITLDPERTYYLMLDGYLGSVCNVNLIVERYLPMESITDWYHTVGGFLGSSTYWYRDVGDTIINGLEYRTIDVYPEPDFPYNRFLREETNTKKVYSYNPFTEQENLLYDFRATIGDDINISSAGTYSVIGIDLVESEYGNLKRWELDGPGPSIFVVEGIGSADLFLANTASDPVFGLLCAYNQSDKIFGNDNCMPPSRWAVNDTLLTATICEGESYFFGGLEYQESGTFVDSLLNSDGIDSIVTLELNVLPIGIYNIEEVLCEGESITINEIIFDEDSPAGNIILFNASANGCDSVITVDLNFIPTIMENYEALICEGSFEIWEGDTISTAGEYTFNFISSIGCDSIINLSVEVIDDIISETNLTACEGENIIVDGIEITESGVYQNEYEASTGCDSVVILNVTFLSTVSEFDTLTFCPDDPIIIDGLPVEEGVYETVSIGVNGCDSFSTVYVVELSESDPECLSSTNDVESLELLISPNPFSNMINLSSEENIETLEVLSITGARIDYINTINERNYIYNGSGIPSGVYLLKVSSKNKIALKRIVKH